MYGGPPVSYQFYHIKKTFYIEKNIRSIKKHYMRRIAQFTANTNLFFKIYK